MTITITGQIMGGKNHVNITRTGHRYPNKTWAAWRDAKVAEVRAQKTTGHCITEPVNISVEYVAGDRRRRDMPAIIDSLFHILERAGIVADDALLWVSLSTRSYDKTNPRAKITFLP